MKRSKVFILLILLFFVESVSAITFNQDTPIPIGDTDYRFIQPISVDYTKTTNTTLFLNDASFSIFANNNHVNVTFEYFVNNSCYSILYNASRNGTIFFNITGLTFRKEYIGTTEQIRFGSLPDPTNKTQELLQKYFETPQPQSTTDFVTAVLPLLIIMGAMLIIFSFLRF